MLAKGSAGPVILCSIPSLILLLMGYIYSAIFYILGLVFLLLPSFSLYFFRDPERMVSKGIVSPADGRVLEVSKNHITIFMSVTDVHVNRTPVKGEVVNTDFYKGGHMPAYKKESDKNFRHRVEIRNKRGTFVVWQITGIVARRIVPYIKEGDTLERGEKIGMIRFGSRVRVEIPDTVRLIVREGDVVKAGESKIGVWR
ncbi:MAG: phosphatidylserine decarboxylase [Thermoplasmatota archaeon]